jgi:Flp pilus assembly protein TadG
MRGRFLVLATRRCQVSPRPQSRKGINGQSLVELALFAPILLLVVLVTLDLGRVYLGWVTLNNVARIGANYAALNPSAWEGAGNASAQAAYQQLMQNDTGGIDCAMPNPLPDPTFPDPAPNTYIVGSHVTVDLHCNFRLLTPLLANLMGGGGTCGSTALGTDELCVAASTTFIIRTSWTGTQPIGGDNPTPSPSPTPSPTPTATPTPTPSGSGASPTPTPTPPIVTFYGSPDGVDSYGGGSDPTDPDYNQIVGIPGLYVTFYNTTSGTHGSCQWSFGDGSTSNSCVSQVVHTYSGTTRTTYDVSLTVDGGNLVRSTYVLISCKVPAFSGVQTSQATNLWTAAGFDGNNIHFAQNGNWKIGSQTLAGGLVDPPGGCSGAQITVDK